MKKYAIKRQISKIIITLIVFNAILPNELLAKYQTTLPNNLNQIQLHLTPLQPGFYSYRVTSGKQQFYGKLLIK
jgi:hypothetical protein